MLSPQLGLKHCAGAANILKNSRKWDIMPAKFIRNITRQKLTIEG
jgi:hypothetical protein